jgi:hypothetical protein
VILDQRCSIAGGDVNDGFFYYDCGNGRWYSFRLERVLWVKNLG